jgi:isopenicillin N synthase-like dioxygenase
MSEFVREFSEALAIGLGLKQDYFLPYLTANDHSLRLLRYPQISKEVEGERAGAHTDYGFVTFLFQQQIGGLQVKNLATNEFVHVAPLEGGIVVNIADMLQRWSCDYLKSSLHRVVSCECDDEGVYPEV